MERLVEPLGVTSLSKSQVSVMAKELDEAMEAFRSRPLDAVPYTFVAADALVLKVRENGRVVGAHTLIATGGNAEGYREILGLSAPPGTGGAAVQVLPGQEHRRRPGRDEEGTILVPVYREAGEGSVAGDQVVRGQGLAAPPRAVISRGSLC